MQNTGPRESALSLFSLETVCHKQQSCVVLVSQVTKCCPRMCSNMTVNLTRNKIEMGILSKRKHLRKKKKKQTTTNALVAYGSAAYLYWIARCK